MAIETKRDKLIYQGLVPVAGAVLGAIAAIWFQSATIDKAQLNDLMIVLKDPALNAQQKLQALELYKEITDRPWAILRSITTGALTLLGTLSVALMWRVSAPKQ